MQTRNFFALAMVSLALASIAFLTACGSSKTQPPAPTFTSTPVTAATEGTAYTYQLAASDPAGGSVTFSLTASPTGATLSGNTVTWTPTAAQAHVSNSFAVTATTASGGTAQQSWAVTPGGTVTVNWINNYWGPSGAVQVPQQASSATTLSAIWTNPDGSYSVQKSSATTTPGVFIIPNVPGGYYWLADGSSYFWTNVNTFDAGQNYAGPPTPLLNPPQGTQFDFNLSGLASVPEFTNVEFIGAASGLPGFLSTDDPNSTSLSQQGFGIGSNVDWSQINTAFLFQWVPTTVGTLNNAVIGPSLTATDLSLVNGGTNTITETLQASPQASINLSVPGGSQWAPMFANAGPGTLTPYGSALTISAQMYVTNGLASGTVFLAGVGVAGSNGNLTLAGTLPTDGVGPSSGCNPMGFLTYTPTPPQLAITTDQNFGTLQYGDPFPSGWARTVTLCQEAYVSYPIGQSIADFFLVDSATVAPSSSPLGPVVLPVQSPTIEGVGSLFGGTSLNTNIVNLSWSAPSGTAPFGYTVRVYVQTTVAGMPTFAATGAVFNTASTSITLPPLAGGNTYVFAVTADADGSANMQTSPFRSSLPTGTATVVSGPVSINPAAQIPAIHGDRRVITQLSQPQPQGAAH